ncbi:uncharacterized protein LOC111709874 isoform X2 [Eurytemora carolleeae]|uniref:uncharacterized protein LOC111709874 isoform X2 n=1 Tax=Eurytemora carolleeae TaxID=1294199 RepID=UPI000C7737C7|nr:uncharacterized protein LOC111709874 isoform X2 [Eurytemora carolleeae]|eukprot:XP_023339570.1 uncharacterized protein LOC111709874 isoform X2 [Eurytemora affinis]
MLDLFLCMFPLKVGVLTAGSTNLVIWTYLLLTSVLDAQFISDEILFSVCFSSFNLVSAIFLLAAVLKENTVLCLPYIIINSSTQILLTAGILMDVNSENYPGNEYIGGYLVFICAQIYFTLLVLSWRSMLTKHNTNVKVEMDNNNKTLIVAIDGEEKKKKEKNAAVFNMKEEQEKLKAKRGGLKEVIPGFGQTSKTLVDIDIHDGKSFSCLCCNSTQEDDDEEQLYP